MVMTGRCACHCESVSSSSLSDSDDSDSRDGPSQSSVSASVSGSASQSASISASSRSGSLSASGSFSWCFVPKSDQGLDNWYVYRNDVLIGSGFGSSWPEIDEGVDTSDDAATAIRPSMSNEDGGAKFDMGIPDAIGGIIYPEHWTHVISVTARMRARVIQFGTSPITTQTIEVAIGEDEEKAAGDVIFSVDSQGYDTYEEIPTGGVSLPARIGDLDISTWFMNETRYLEHNVEISAIEICVTGGALE